MRSPSQNLREINAKCRICGECMFDWLRKIVENCAQRRERHVDVLGVFVRQCGAQMRQNARAKLQRVCGRLLTIRLKKANEHVLTGHSRCLVKRLVCKTANAKCAEQTNKKILALTIAVSRFKQRADSSALANAIIEQIHDGGVALENKRRVRLNSERVRAAHIERRRRALVSGGDGRRRPRVNARSSRRLEMLRSRERAVCAVGRRRR